MSRRQNAPLRALTAEECTLLGAVARSGSERADRVSRAKAILAVVAGASYTAAALRSGRRSGDGVALLVARFNRDGLVALDSRHGGGPKVRYGPAERERILREFRRTPDRQQEGTATWSLTPLRRALRRAPDGLPHVSTATILAVLWEAGYTWQRSRTWVQTGTVLRKRKGGVERVTDPDAGPKKS